MSFHNNRHTHESCHPDIEQQQSLSHHSLYIPILTLFSSFSSSCITFSNTHTYSSSYSCSSFLFSLCLSAHSKPTHELHPNCHYFGCDLHLIQSTSSTGSPADRSDCDEVLEINGRSLDDANHQDIIQYIHQVNMRPLLILIPILLSSSSSSSSSLTSLACHSLRALGCCKEIPYPLLYHILPFFLSLSLSVSVSSHTMANGQGTIDRQQPVTV